MNFEQSISILRRPQCSLDIILVSNLFKIGISTAYSITSRRHIPQGPNSTSSPYHYTKSPSPISETLRSASSLYEAESSSKDSTHHNEPWTRTPCRIERIRDMPARNARQIFSSIPRLLRILGRQKKIQPPRSNVHILFHGLCGSNGGTDSVFFCGMEAQCGSETS